VMEVRVELSEANVQDMEDQLREAERAFEEESSMSEANHTVHVEAIRSRLNNAMEDVRMFRLRERLWANVVESQRKMIATVDQLSQANTRTPQKAMLEATRTALEAESRKTVEEIQAASSIVKESETQPVFNCDEVEAGMATVGARLDRAQAEAAEWRRKYEGHKLEGDTSKLEAAELRARLLEASACKEDLEEDLHAVRAELTETLTKTREKVIMDAEEIRRLKAELSQVKVLEEEVISAQAAFMSPTTHTPMRAFRDRQLQSGGEILQLHSPGRSPRNKPSAVKTARSPHPSKLHGSPFIGSPAGVLHGSPAVLQAVQSLHPCTPTSTMDEACYQRGTLARLL